MPEVRALGNVSLYSGAESFSLVGVGADDEHGVVAGDGADDFVPLLLIECCGNRLRTAQSGQHDEEVLCLADLQTEVFEYVLDRGQIVFFFKACGKGVAAGALHELQLADIARERGLGYMDSFAGELATHVVLVGDGGLHQQVFDRVMALVFHAGCLFLSCFPVDLLDF